jgi:ABC-type transport system involved in multi-copper enzyme maturation permease subunit
MTQTLALLVDAYRELNSKKLFWISLIVSLVVVVAFALVDITETGLRFVMWDVDSRWVNTKIVSRETFFKGLFISLGIQLWLTWAATILALISTAGIVPDFITSGSIDLVLSKPMSRLRLFFVKYASSLAFVGLQVGVFSAASFVLLGVKADAWEPAVLLAIPLVLVFFSYLFCVCTLLGLLTRSTIAALLLTLLFWLLLFCVHAAESGAMSFKLMAEQGVAENQRLIERNEAALARMAEAKPDAGVDDTFVRRVQDELASQRSDLAGAQRALETSQTIHRIIYGVKTVLPKTAETIALLERWMIDLAELEPAAGQQAGRGQTMFGVRIDEQQLQMDAQEQIRSRSVAWVMGTSLLFELVVLSIAGWLFVRRDF